MKKIFLPSLLALALAATSLVDSAGAFERTLQGAVAYHRAQRCPWHGAYVHPAYNMPIALVVPPTAEKQTHWGWGVGNTRITTIRHQFGRNYPGPMSYDGSAFRARPGWPSSTDESGVYYVRGPW
ncbi:MAG: hypothetical protein JW818_19970 [Pirellulales bacterium]|nr:hypothetical protein [Pirellulales bacterium]